MDELAALIITSLLNLLHKEMMFEFAVLIIT